SGKSTLIRCINRLEEHQQGDIIVDGMTLDKNLKNIDHIRSEVGMVFQSFNLFPHLTIIENLTLGPIWVRKTPKVEAREAAMKYLARVKIPEQAAKYPGQLSGGQQQRVAIARALANDPPLIIGDEPTANLDRMSADVVFNTFQELREQGHTIIIVTPERNLVKNVPTVLTLQDGLITDSPLVAAVES
ncbi:MAG: amino acid ABC transporter ATP-binding protein, partial [Gammaproteobacteria bacterium]|nr:amino acid ABC transporter ATP-binding protein [Gammaproteobacteria bacterium]